MSSFSLVPPFHNINTKYSQVIAAHEVDSYTPPDGKQG